MRFWYSLLFVAAIAATPLACGSSDDAPPAQGIPGGGPGADQDGDATTGEDGGAVDPGPDAAKEEWVRNTTETFDHAGVTRKYILSVPIDYDAAKKYPVYMFMHGNPGAAENMAGGYPVHPATKNEAIVVYPNALTVDWDFTLNDNVDVTYLKALIDQVDAKVSIDKSRILFSGWSGGGFMASQMACRYSGLFRAIGIYSGGAPFDPESQDPNYVPPCTGATIATFVAHGGKDGTVEPGSGVWAGEYWAGKNGCSAGKSASTPTPCEEYQGCPADTPVKVCIIPSDGHPLWSGAHAAAWAWFKALP